VWLYVITTDQKLSLVRTLVWYLSNGKLRMGRLGAILIGEVGCIFTTLLKAASKINA
jgi:hypothetical protein